MQSVSNSDWESALGCPSFIFRNASEVGVSGQHYRYCSDMHENDPKLYKALSALIKTTESLFDRQIEIPHAYYTTSYPDIRAMRNSLMLHLKKLAAVQPEELRQTIRSCTSYQLWETVFPETEICFGELLYNITKLERYNEDLDFEMDELNYCLDHARKYISKYWLLLQKELSGLKDGSLQCCECHIREAFNFIAAEAQKTRSLRRYIDVVRHRIQTYNSMIALLRRDTIDEVFHTMNIIFTKCGFQDIHIDVHRFFKTVSVTEPVAAASTSKPQGSCSFSILDSVWADDIFQSITSRNRWTGCLQDFNIDFNVEEALRGQPRQVWRVRSFFELLQGRKKYKY